jgi:hypothetical protein
MRVLRGVVPVALVVWLVIFLHTIQLPQSQNTDLSSKHSAQTYSPPTQPSSAPQQQQLIEDQKVLVFIDDYQGRVEKAKAGGPGGELKLFNSLMKSLPMHYDFAQSQQDLSAFDVDSYPLIFMDQYGLDSLHSLVKPGDRSKVYDKLRLLDFWGTPPEQNHLKLDLKQFLVPYPNPWNFFLGFVIEPLPESPPKFSDQDSKIHCLLHGKESRYFYESGMMLKSLSDSGDFLFHSTVFDSSFHSQYPFVEAHGLLNSTAFRQLLFQVDFVLGLGHPMLAPTALESIASGTPYFNFLFSQPFSLSDLPKHPKRSQHDFAMELGEPFVYTFNTHDANQVLRFAQMSQSRRFSPKQGLSAVADFSQQAYSSRLEQLLATQL